MARDVHAAGTDTRAVWDDMLAGGPFAGGVAPSDVAPAEWAARAPNGLLSGFVPNHGQFPEGVEFRAVGREATVFLHADAVTVVPHDSGEQPRHVVYSAAARHELVPTDRLPGVLHFLKSSDRRSWVTDVPRYAAVEIRSITRGPAGAPRALKQALHPLLDSVLTGQAPDQQPAPSLLYSTYFGGGRSEVARGIAVDAEGFAYVAGSTTSSDLPTQDPLQPDLGNTGLLQDAFVAKLTRDGTSLVYATYLGGSRQDEAFDVAVDSIGRVHLTGYTMSPDFPMEKNLQDRVNLSDGIFAGDAFATKLSPDGSSLEFSTPLGGTARDLGKGIAVDAAGYVYITGWTGSNFPAVNALYPLNRGVTDAFVVKMSPAGDDVVYSTHLGGSVSDMARDIAVDAAGAAYIVGVTESVNFRVSEPLQRANAGGRDAFVAKFSPDGQAVEWATYLGGRLDDFGTGIALGSAGEVTIVGRTHSPTFPMQDPFQRQRSGPADLFVSRFTPDGASLSFSTFLGGSAVEADCAAMDRPRVAATPTPAPGVPRLPEGSRFPDGPIASVDVDGSGRIYVSTCTASGNAPVERPIQSVRSGSFAGYVAVLDPSGSGLEFGTYLGGRALDIPRALAVGADGAVYLAGQTTSTDFPLAPTNPLLPRRSGTDDAFVLKIAPPVAQPSPTPVPPSATPEETPTSAASATAVASATVQLTATPTDQPTRTATPTTPAPIWLPWACNQCEGWR